MRIENAAAAMGVIRDALHDHDIRSLSVRTGISKSALHAIRCGRTRWPRDYTLFALMVYLGIEVHFIRRK